MPESTAWRMPPQSLRSRWLRRWTPLLLLGYNFAIYGVLRLLTPHLLTNGDAARLGTHAWDLLTRQVWPFYIYHLYAPNPLIVFLEAGAFAVFGINLDALNGVTIAAGCLAGVAAYRAGFALFQDEDRKTAYRAGLIAGLSFPLTTIVVAFMSGGTEHALLPLFALAIVAALWRGLRSGRYPPFAVAGALLGLSQYSYIVARALPVALAAALGLLALCYPAYRRRWRGLLLMYGMFALVAAPQWAVFIAAPPTFLARSNQSAGQFVFSRPDFLRIIGQKAIAQVRMLGWSWESGYNLSGRALLTPPLVIGLILSLRRRPAALFAWTLALAFLGLELVTYEEAAPSATRLMGAIPFILLLCGYGLARLWSRLEGLSSRLGWLPVALVLGFGIGRQVEMVARVLPETYARPGAEWRASLVEDAEAAYILAHDDEPILLASSEYQRAPLAFLLAEHYPERAGSVPPSLVAGEHVRVIIPAEPERLTTDGPPAGYVPDTWVLLSEGAVRFLPSAPGGVDLSGTPTVIQARNGAAAALVYEGTWLGLRSAMVESAVKFENGIELAGYNLSRFGPGEPLDVDLFWRASERLPSDVQLITQLLDKDGGKLAGIHDWVLHGAYRARAWRPGEIVPLTYRFSIPEDVTPGAYRLAVGVSDIQTQRNVPTTGGEDLATAALLKIPLPPPTTSPDHLSRATAGPLALEGYTLTSSGGRLTVRFFWQATASPGADYTLFVHLLDAQGELVAQADGEPYGGRYPTSLWASGERVTDERELTVPPGKFLGFTGWYLLETGERLPASIDGVPLSDNQIPLGEVVIP